LLNTCHLVRIDKGCEDKTRADQRTCLAGFMEREEGVTVVGESFLVRIAAFIKYFSYGSILAKHGPE